MAEDKKSFVAYADWKETFDKLPDEVAGKLIKHIFSYVNDENPVSDDYVIEAVFSNIKNTLKRDLKKWETQLEQRREAGKRSAEQRALNKSNERSISLNEIERNSTVSDSVNVSVSVSVNENENENEIKKENRNNIFLAELIISDEWLNVTGMQAPNKYKPDKVKLLLKKYNDQINSSFDFKDSKKEYCRHFVNWLNKQPKISGPTTNNVIS